MNVARWVGAVVVATGVLAAASASAQETGQIGVTAGSPGLGVIWHGSDNVALRAELAFGLGWGDAQSETSLPVVTPTQTSSSDSRSVGAGLSALFYAGRWDNLRTYFSPRFQYTRGTSTSSSDPGTGEHKSTSSSYALSGSLGAQYVVGKGFSVFGEVGLLYGRATSTSRTTSATSEGHSNTFGTRTGVGVAFYF